MLALSSSKTMAFCARHSLRNNCFWSFNRIYMSSSITSEASQGGKGPNTHNKNKEKRYQAAREKRRKFIGMAKAVDRGQFAVTYKPRSDSGKFQSRSGLPDRTKLFTVLGVESSCDDTGAAVVRSDGKILGESLASQQEIHEEWGGVVPGLARDAHASKIDSVIQEALDKSDMTIDDVDAIGVTVGPGLEICLRVGCDAAKDLAVKYNKPFVGVHHLEAHILMARIGEGVNISATSQTHESTRTMDFPFLALLVSGGHCQLMKCYGIGNYSIIGGTMDDSLGEAFDKTARLLGLPVGGGGGPAVEQLAKQGDPDSVELPIPLQRRKDCDFSYAGLKTAVRMAADRIRIERGMEAINDLPFDDKANIAASFQNVAIKHIEQRLKRAMKLCEDEDNIKTLAVVGGVAANQELRSRLDSICQENEWIMHVPPPRLCTDQGAMSAWASVERIMVGSTDVAEIQEVYARYPFSVVS
eukprot:CAMPEP_0194220502 /NCGR_PEP_ID=MMETSP0156-20130528/28552_1 /TAXON_ID=33649 /ORGANISM="Thalassionema nitzschioides, Strain L26-B" /LENGTH=470 /DNA_ID=CAMNT_0038950567 /DNA_START=123 /DNA_END=1535 /DNA_ORIENTATION=+